MNVDLMRKIDYYFGIPLTLLGSGVIKVVDLFRAKTPLKPQRILFVELSEMGSTIIADPAMKRARDKFDAELYFVIFSKNKPSLDLLGTIKDEHIFKLREDNLFTLVLDAVKFIFWCRKHNIDTAVDLELFSRVSALLTGFSFARHRVGFHNFHGEGLYRGHMISHKVSYNPHIHIAKNFIALIHALEAEKDENPYAKIKISDADIKLDQVEFNEDQKQPIYAKVQALYPDFQPNDFKLVLINPNASELLPQRRWPKDRYQTLMQNILMQHQNILILITGAPGEMDEAEQLRIQVDHPRCINFAGQLKLQQMPILYCISELMVTNDSGPGHFSSITPLKTFVLFGPETPKLYGSLGNSIPIYAGLACSPCVSAANHRKTPCIDPVCMQAIKVDEVEQAVNAHLNQ